MASKAVEILMRFTLDRQGQKAVSNNLTELKKTLDNMRAEAEKTRTALANAIKSAADEAPRLQQELETIETTIRSIEQEATDTFAKQYVDAARKAAEETQNLAERAGRLGVALGAAGGAGLLAMGGLASKYAEFSGMAEDTSRAWLDTSDRIEQAQLRLGRASAQALDPWRNALAGILEQMASIAEQNPGTMSGMAAGAVAAAGAGGGLAAVSQGIRLVADMKFLSAVALQKTAAQDMLKAAGIQAGAATAMKGAGAAGSAGKVLSMAGIAGLLGTAGTAAGVVGGGMYLGNLAGKKVSGGTGIEHFAAIGAHGVGYLVGGEQKANEFFTAVGKLTGALDESTAAAMEAAMAEKELATNRILPEEAVNSYIAYRQQEAQAEEQYSQQRAQIVEEYASQRKQIEEQYEQDRTNIVEQYAERRAQITENYEKRQTEATKNYNRTIERQARDFAQNEARIQADYYRQRSEMVKDYHEDVQRAEEDHQRRMRQMQMEHQARSDDLIAARDALGLAREMRDYENNRQQVEDEHQIDMKRHSQDFAEQLREMEANFREQRQRRLEDYQQRLADQEEDFQRQQEQAQEAYEAQLQDLEDAEQEQLSALEQSYQDQLTELEQHKRDMLAKLKQQYLSEKNARDQAFRDQLRQMKLFHGDQLTAWEAFYDRMREELQDFIDETSASSDIDVADSSNNDSGGSGGKKARASGGYASFGEYLLGERGTEFVMSAPATQAAERMIGGRLDQQNILAAMSGRNGGGMVVNLHLPSGVMSMADRRAIINASSESALNGLARALEMVK